MKRITGAVVMLVGLGGCLSPNAPVGQAEKKTAAAKPASHPGAPGPGLPTNPQWTPHPAHVSARPPAAKPLPPGAVMPGQVTAVPPTALAANVKATPSSVAPATLPVTPAPVAPVPMPNGFATAAKRPPALPAGMPKASTPPTATAPGTIQQTGHVARQPQPDSVVPANGSGIVAPIGQAAYTPPPVPDLTGKGHAAPSHPVGAGKGGPPLMRLVNTKRITLNFQVQNVGQSGLSTVELWYTQDGKDWKKYDAPTQAQAYVVEVDEEGMYGFTLLARSGLGLGKDPPKAGDQPQVWVVVDLTKPDVQLQEVTPGVNAKMQHVTIGWKASDKNMTRQPISLWYAEKEEGPWKIIAASVENTGKYLWQVPPDVPGKFLVRVEAADLAGNVGRAQSPRPVLLDMNKPEVTITNVEAHVGP